MLIFNTTFLVSDKATDAWLQWVQQEYIHFMVGSTYFSKPQVAKVLIDEEQDGTSYSVQFHVLDMEMLQLWNQGYGATFQENCAREFGTEVIFFSTVLEIVEK